MHVKKSSLGYTDVYFSMYWEIQIFSDDLKFEWFKKWSKLSSQRPPGFVVWPYTINPMGHELVIL